MNEENMMAVENICNAHEGTRRILNHLPDDFCPACGCAGSWFAEEADGVVCIQYRCLECGPIYQHMTLREVIEQDSPLRGLAGAIRLAWIPVCIQISTERGWKIRGEMPFHCGRPGKDAGISDRTTREFFCERCGSRFRMPLIEDLTTCLVEDDIDTQILKGRVLREVQELIYRDVEGEEMTPQEEWAADVIDVINEILGLGIDLHPAWESAPEGRKIATACGVAGVERAVFVKTAARLVSERYPDQPGLEGKLLKRWRRSRSLPGMISTGWEECKASQVK